jgi:hypothetical protein
VGVLSTASANAAILVHSPNGGDVAKNSLESARTAADAAGKTVVVTSSLSSAQSNISGNWPANIALKVEKGGSINNTTTFNMDRYGSFEAGLYPCLLGSGGVTLPVNVLIQLLWFGATGNYVANDTVPIRRAIASAPPYGHVHFNNCSTAYLVDSTDTISHTFTIGNPITITSDPHALIKLAASSNLHQLLYGHMFVVSSHDVTLDGLQVDANYRNNPFTTNYGAYSDASAGAIVLLNGVASSDGYAVNYNIKNCTIYDSGFTSIGIGSLGPSSVPTMMTGITLDNNTIYGGLQDQIPIAFAKDVKILNGHYYNGSQYMVHPYTAATHITIANNYFWHDAAPVNSQTTIWELGIGHNAYPNTVYDVSAIGNHFNSSADATTNRQSITVQGGAARTKLIGNAILGGTNGIVTGWGAIDTIASGNSIQQTWNSGLDIRGATKTIYSNNTITSANQSGGSAAADSAMVIQSETGTYASTASYNTLLGNIVSKGTLTNKPTHGIFINSGSNAPSDTIIKENDLSDFSGATGVYGATSLTALIMQHNVGYATESGGYIGATSSGGTVAHGLVAAPSLVTITPIDGGKTNIHAVADGTNVTISFDGGGTERFYWSARTW